MKNFNKDGLSALRDFYLRSLNRRAPKLAPYLELCCFLSAHDLENIHISFEFQVNKEKQDRPKEVYKKAARAMSFIGGLQERHIAEKFGIDVKTGEMPLGDGKAVFKTCHIPRGAFPLRLRKRRADLNRRYELLSEARDIFEEITKSLDSDVESGGIKRRAKEAVSLYSSAKPRGISQSRSSYKKGVQEFFRIPELEFGD